MSDMTPPGIPPVPEETPYAPPAGQIVPPAPAGDLALTANDKTMGMACHLAAFAGYVGIPFGSLIGPLVMWITQKDKSAYLDYHGKESLNFQITIVIALLICIPLILLLGLGILLAIMVYVYGFVMTIIAAIKANEGVRYAYPYALRLIK